MMKKLLVSAVMLMLTAAIVLFCFTAAAPAPVAVHTVTVFPLEYTALTDTVDVPGIVQSQTVTKVYSTLSYPVFNVAVRVGDVVSEGDLLCQLDTEALELSIQQQSTAITSAQSKAGYSLTVAQSDLSTAQFNLEEKYNAALIKAEADLKSAEAAMKNAEIAVQAAENDVVIARENWRNERGHESDYPDDDAYDKAIRNLRNIVSMKEIALDASRQTLENARQTLTIVQAAKVAAETAARDQIESYRQRVRTAELAGDLSDQWLGVQKLKLDLEKATVTSPVAGVVTAVNVSEGAPGGGLLFVIEDIEHLEVSANVGEYDIIHVRTDSPTEIRPDADESDLYEGVVTSIAPASAKNAAGDTVASGAASYETKAAITSKSGNLRIGMHIRMKITVGQRERVFAVPYASVTKNAGGESVVLVARPTGDGGYVAEQVPVVRGLEPELLVEISSDRLSEGDLILSGVQGVRAGDRVVPQ